MKEHFRQEEQHGASAQLPRRGNLEQLVEKLEKLVGWGDGDGMEEGG